MSEKIIFGAREMVDIILPVSKGTVTMYKYLTVQETREITSKYKNITDPNHVDAQDANLDMISRMIVSWNFTDESGTDLPVSKEILSQFSNPDIELIGTTITSFSDKKKS